MISILWLYGGIKTMSLIICPECGREVSTLAASCPGCGYPISSKKDNNDNINNYTDFDIILTDYIKDRIIPSVTALKGILPLDIYNSKRAVKNVPCIVSKNKDYNTAQVIKQRLEEAGLTAIIHPSSLRYDRNDFDLDILTCPCCGSFAITTGQKGFSLFTGFLGSNKTVNRCGNCGHTWSPGN